MSSIIAKTPDGVLKTIAAGNEIKNQYGYLLPKASYYFLPSGKQF